MDGQSTSASSGIDPTELTLRIAKAAKRDFDCIDVPHLNVVGSLGLGIIMMETSNGFATAHWAEEDGEIRFTHLTQGILDRALAKSDYEIRAIKLVAQIRGSAQGT